jgi:phage terminase large subunit
MDWQTLVSRWSASPFHFVLEALFHIREEEWRPWTPGTPRPPHSPKGMELWQANFLRDVARAKTEGKRRFSVRSGHGTGKSTTQAWLILWFLLFQRDLKIPVTANSADQLRDVLFSEIAKWHRELPPFLKDMLELNTERISVKADPEASFAVARTARPERPEALQGFHAGTLVFMIEEASAIEDVIFEVAGGALSSDNSWVFLFGNPTRTSGYFYRSHHENMQSWRTYHIPCQVSSRVSEDYPKQIALEYGENSNVYRVRVLGEFPMEEDNSVVPMGLIKAAVDRDVSPNDFAIVWGLDVARFGDDTTCLCKRRGNVILEPLKEWKKYDLMQTVGVIMQEWRLTPLEQRPSAINVDVIGLGAGVVDRLRELGLPVRGVNVGEQAATSPERFMRLRDELWWKTREWFDSRAVTMPNDEALIVELAGPTYKLESTGKIKVESKDAMKKRGRKSPNRADALCLTFAGGDHSNELVRRATAVSDYDPFAVNSDDFERHVRRASSAGMEYRPF